MKYVATTPDQLRTVIEQDLVKYLVSFCGNNSCSQ